jgi:hypothetical protein
MLTANSAVITQIHLEPPLVCITNNGVLLVTHAQITLLALLATVKLAPQASTLKWKERTSATLFPTVTTVLDLLPTPDLKTLLHLTREVPSDLFCVLLGIIVPLTQLVVMPLKGQLTHNCALSELMEARLV